MTVQAVNNVQPGLESKHLDFNQFDYNSVNLDYVNTFVCPEKYCYRKTTNYPSATALARGSQEQIITSDATGNVAMFIFPQVATSSGGSVS